MDFVVVNPDVQIPIQRYPFAVLTRDNWDDYHFKTTFWLSVHLSPAHRVDVGTVKILYRHQTEGWTPVYERFQSLNLDYCSLGQSLSYYEKLHELGRAIRDSVLSALRDVVQSPNIADSFRDHPGFKKSLERSGSAARAIHDAAPLLRAMRPPTGDDAMSLTFETSVGGDLFEVPLSFNEVPELPGRINVIVGYNGTGKTRLLANLAHVAYADLEDRQSPEAALPGRFIDDPSVRFGAVVAISYSAFDTFEIPGTGRSAAARERVEKDGELFGYAYCGLRKLEPGDAEPDAYRLKSIAELHADTHRALDTVVTHRKPLLVLAISNLLREPSFQRAGFSLDDIEDKQLFSDAFARLSTGHKIVLNIVLQLVAHLQLKSLVLFDEPECHLHPPLLAALLRSIGVVLDDRDSYAVIATHSPVVVQEIPGRYVQVLERFGTVNAIREPRSETFGENIGYLTRTIFNLDGRSTDYHGVLDELASRFTLEQIEDLFDGEMSTQARSYVKSIQRAQDL